MEKNKTYVIRIVADGISFHQVIADKDDLDVLLAVLKKVENNATETVKNLEPAKPTNPN